jgi:hypothetical protein
VKHRLKQQVNNKKELEKFLKKLPIQAMMNPVAFYSNRGEWTYAVKCLACSAHSEGTNNAASPARVLT